MAKATMHCTETGVQFGECLHRNGGNHEKCLPQLTESILCNVQHMLPRDFEELRSKCGNNFQSEECSALMQQASLSVDKMHFDSTANVVPMNGSEFQGLMACAGRDFSGMPRCTMKHMESSAAFKEFEACYNTNKGDLTKCEREGANVLGGAGRHASRALKTMQTQALQQRKSAPSS